MPHVASTVAKGKTYLYYRRGKFSRSLPAPENGPKFRAAYNKAHSEYETGLQGDKTLAWAINGYLNSADFRQTSAATQRLYRYFLEPALNEYAEVGIEAVDS